MYADLPLLFCGSDGAAIRLARDGGLKADQIFADVPNPCGSGGAAIRLAREGGLPADQSLAGIPGSTVGASLLAKTARQPPEILRMYRVPVGASLLAIAVYRRPGTSQTNDPSEQAGR